jgi:hypothetical protein
MSEFADRPEAFQRMIERRGLTLHEQAEANERAEASAPAGTSTGGKVSLEALGGRVTSEGPQPASGELPEEWVDRPVLRPSQSAFGPVTLEAAAPVQKGERDPDWRERARARNAEVYARTVGVSIGAITDVDESTLVDLEEDEDDDMNGIVLGEAYMQ